MAQNSPFFFSPDLANLGTGTFGVPMPSQPSPGYGTIASPIVTAPQLSATAAAPAAATTPPGGFMQGFGDWAKRSGFVGSTDANGIRTDGWGSLAVGAASGVMNGWLGLQQLNIAKKTLNENKRQFQMNFDAQRKTVNSALEDRQRARVASNAGAYQSVGDYMKKNGI